MKIELKDKSVAFVQSHDLEYIHPLSRKIQRYFFFNVSFVVCRSAFLKNPQGFFPIA